MALTSLYDVFDPEIGLNVVDLGLIYSVNFDEDKKVMEVNMTLTTQFCPMGESLTSEVTYALNNAFKTYQVTVNLIFDPEWNYDCISPEGQEFLIR